MTDSEQTQPISLGERLKEAWQWILGILTILSGLLASLFQGGLTWDSLWKALLWFLALAIFVFLSLFIYHLIFTKSLAFSKEEKIRRIAQISFGTLFILSFTAINFLCFNIIKDKDSADRNSSGWALFKKGEFDLAIEEFNKAIEIKPNYAEAFNNLGQAYDKKADFERTIKNFKKAIERKPDFVEAFNNRGLVYFRKDDMAHAIEDFDKAIKFKPNYAEAYNNRGLVYYVKHNFERAIEDFSKAIEVKPDYAEAYNNRALAYGAIQDFEQASKDHQKSIALGLEDKVIIAVAQFDGPKEYRVTETVLKSLEEALGDYSDVEIMPLDLVIKENEGSETAKKEGLKKNATIVIWGWYEKGDKIVPVSMDFEVLKNSRIFPELGKEAKGSIRKFNIAMVKSFLLQEDLANEISYLSLFFVGANRAQVGDWGGAVTRFTAALSQTTENVAALSKEIIYLYRGQAYFSKGDFASAIQDYTQALGFDAENVEAYYYRGVAYMKKKDFASAIRDYTKALELDPKMVEVYYYRGVSYAKKGMKDKAIADFKQVLQLDKDPATRQLLAPKLKELGAQP